MRGHLFASVVAISVGIATVANAQPIVCHRDPINGMTICTGQAAAPAVGGQAAVDAQVQAADNARAGASGGNGLGLLNLIGIAAQAVRDRKVGKLMAAGHCRDAVNTALSAGDMKLADYARANCQPAQ